MASSAIHGLQGKVLVGGTVIAELIDVTLTVSSDRVDVTNKTTSEVSGIVWKEYIYGPNDWSASGSVNYVQSEATMTTIEDAILGQTALAFEFRDKTGTGRKKWTGNGIISNLRFQQPANGQQICAFDISSAGALTRGTQS